MKTLKSVPVPDEFVAAAGGQEAARRQMAQLVVLDLVRRDIISSGRAAELLGVSRWEIQDLLREHRIATVHYHPEEREEEEAAFRQAVREGA